MRCEHPKWLNVSASCNALPVPTTPEQFGAFMAAERGKYEKIVRASGARVD